MTNEIRCPFCNKLVAKKEKNANTHGILFFCTRCKENFKEKECSSSHEKQ